MEFVFLASGIVGLWSLGVIVFMGQLKRKYFVAAISVEDLEIVDKMFPTKEALKDFEFKLDLETASLEDRLLLIRGFFFRSDYTSDIVRQHILWIIRNAPSVKANWIELGVFFHFCPDGELKKAIDLFKVHVQNDPKNVAILWNATVFSDGVDNDFSLNCAMKVYSLQPLNPAVVWRVAFCAEKFDSQLSVQMYMRRLNMPWDENEFLALEKVRSLGFRFLLPDFIADKLLRLLSYVGWIDFEYSLAEYAHACRGILDSGEKNVSFDRYTKEIEHLLSKYQLSPENETYTYIYSVLGRIAIRRNDLVGLKKYLDKMSVQPVGVMHLYYACDEPLLKDMIQIGAKDEARRYFLARQIEHLDLPAVQEMKKTLFD